MVHCLSACQCLALLDDLSSSSPLQVIVNMLIGLMSNALDKVGHPGAVPAMPALLLLILLLPPPLLLR